METIEYSKKSLENGSAFVEKLLGAKSFQSAIYVRSEYAKTSYAALVAYLRVLHGTRREGDPRHTRRCLGIG